MSKQNPTVLASLILSLPQEVRSLREQAENLLAKADQLAALLPSFDRAKLDSLTLTGNPKLDVALRLSMESGHEWLSVFPMILEELQELEGRIAFWKEGGLMLADLTLQNQDPLCLSLTILKVPPQPALQILTTSGYFHNIPVSIQIPARLLMAWNSNTLLWGIENCTDLSSMEYELSEDRFRLKIAEMERCSELPITTTFDLTQLLHPNWGTRNVHLAGVVFGNQAILEHVREWRTFVNQGRYMSDGAKEFYSKFLEEFHSAVLELTAAQTQNSVR